MPEVMRKLRRVKGYKELFKKAFGDEEIDPFVMTEAIATFEKQSVAGRVALMSFWKGIKSVE